MKKSLCNLSMQEIFSVAHEIVEQWFVSNSEFKKAIVSDTKAIELRLSRGCSAFFKIAQHKV